MNSKGVSMDSDLVYFDTNIFIDVADGDITSEDWQSMIRFTKERRMTKAYCIINLIELGSKLNTITYKDFGIFKKPFNAIKRCCSQNILPDPESVLASYFDGRPLKGQRDMLIYVDLIVSARDYWTFKKGPVFSKGRESQRYKVVIDYLADFRKSYEDSYRRDMEQIITNISPGYVLGLDDTPAVKDRKLREELNALFVSDEFKRIVLKALLERCSPLFDKDMKVDANDISLLEPLDGYVSLYRYILQQIVNSGRKAEQKKNDFNDLDFLLYLGKQWLFVTNEKQFKRALASSTQKNQVMNFIEFLTFLQQGGL